MAEYFAAVIGGGAAGITAAISLARRGKSVILCEKMPQIGKKILASGNGRCNLLNEDLSEDSYNPASRQIVKSVFAAFDKSSILDFFQGIGLEVYSREGRIFPVTNQAASVLKVLEMELKRLSVPVELNFNCSGLSIKRHRILVSSQTGRNIECRCVIITGGGKTYPALGSDGSTYKIASQLGHSIITPVPSAVPLVVKDRLCFLLQGQRIAAAARSIIAGSYGEETKGELLFTRYGLSGTCILDISEGISLALNRHRQREVCISVDMVPFMSSRRLREELAARRKKNYSTAEMLVGILPNKLSTGIKDLFEQNDIDNAVNSLKARRFAVTGTRGWNEAEFTSGGVDLAEINPQTLESKLQTGVYFAGEVLDVSGKRGGYNLAWAWASGYLAGLRCSSSDD